MQKEYDFSKAGRGKFYRAKVHLNFPVYLNRENRDFVEKIALRKKADPIVIVNELLENDRTWLYGQDR